MSEYLFNINPVILISYTVIIFFLFFKPEQ